MKKLISLVSILLLFNGCSSKVEYVYIKPKQPKCFKLKEIKPLVLNFDTKEELDLFENKVKKQIKVYIEQLRIVIKFYEKQCDEYNKLIKKTKND